MTAPATSPPIHKPVHGVPIWGWAIVGAVAIGAILYLRKSGANNNSAKATPVNQGVGYASAGAMPVTTNADTVRILTNQDWSKAAQKDLVQKGHDPAESASACANYIAGNTLTASQTQLIDVALRDIGPLPETPSNGGSKLSRLHTPKDGNLFGELLYGFANAVGLGDPDNPVGGILDPFFNDIIDQGPISGVFQAANQIIGGNVNLQAQGITIDTPIGPITVGGSVSNSGVSAGASTPTGQSIGVGVSSSGTSSYIGTYTVQQGDTLASISQAIYGSQSGAQAIYSANLNKIPDPSSLTPGTVLQIPSPSNNG